ncbi:hypothetical protein Tco_0943206, partial [Tanacetum coccineum]
ENSNGTPPNNLGPDLSGKAVNKTQSRGMIRSLMYLTASRPDIQFSTCLCARYQANPKESHRIVVKRIFRCNIGKKITSCACQLLVGKLMCLSAKKQQSVTMLSAKAEYVVAARCCANILWMKSQLTEYDIIYEKVPIFCDNTSAIAISNNLVLHSRTKHIDIRYHFIRDHILKGDIELHFIPTQYQLADIFSKPLDKPTFKRLIVELGGVRGDIEHMMPEYENEELTINPTQVFSVHNLTLKPNQPEEPPFTDHMKAICNLDVPVDSKAPKPSSQTEETEASKSKTSQLKKDTRSSLAKDKSPSYPLPSTLVVGEMHKEAQQEAGGPTSLGATNEEGAHPQLSSGSNPSVLVDKTKSARDGLKTAHTNSGANEESRADDMSLKVNLEDLSDILKDTRSAFFTPDSPPNKLIIVSDESEEEEEVAKDKDIKATSYYVHLLQSQKEELAQAKVKAKAEVASMKAKPSYPDITQLTELLVTSLKLKLSKLLASHNFASCFPTELKDLPSKITRLSKEIKELKKHVAELKNIQWELLAEFLNLPSQVSHHGGKCTGATSMNVPLAGKATASLAEGEKNTKDAEANL